MVWFGQRGAVQHANQKQTLALHVCVRDRRLRGSRTCGRHVGMQFPMFLSSGERQFSSPGDVKLVITCESWGRWNTAGCCSLHCDVCTSENSWETAVLWRTSPPCLETRLQKHRGDETVAAVVMMIYAASTSSSAWR